jgi:tetratricopeptide (TPR) repeat protein
MLKYLNLRRIGFVSLVGISLFFSGCAKDQLLMETYSPPKKQKEVKQMLAISDLSTGFLKIEIVNDKDYIINGKNKNDGEIISEKLLTDIKKYLTQTNFIAISEIEKDFESTKVSLDMKIIQLNYETTNKSIKGLIEVEFNIRKDEILYTQAYQYKIYRQSRSGKQGLPSMSKIFSDASKYLAKKLVKDISPLQTKKLVELKKAPKGLEYTLNYAKAKNYKNAIKAMKKYKGEKNADYYFNLAVFYEALGAKDEDFALLEKANENYELAIQNGGMEDEVIIKGKNKFDKYYEIIQNISKQKLENAKASQNDQYEILD